MSTERKGGVDDLQEDDGAFDVAVEDAISDRPTKRTRDGSRPKVSRSTRDSKFGFGGKGKRAKQNTRQSTEDFRFGSGSKGKAKGGKSKGGVRPQRPGKGRRMSARK